MPKNRCRLARLTRIALPLTTIAVAFGTQAASSFAASHPAQSRKVTHSSHKSVATKKARTVGALPAQGIFDSCSLSSNLTTCEQDLQQMHQAGMQVAVMSIRGGDSTAVLTSYASYAQSIGMSVMWEINDPGFWGGAWIGSSAATDWGSFSSACGCTGTAQVLSSMIQFLGSLPATYGYYAADDWTLTPSQKGGLKQYVSEIKAVDPDHMVMIGSAQGDGTTYYSTGATIGNEIYPETTSSLMPYSSNLSMWQAVQQSVGQDQRAATQAGTSSAFILQAFTFGDNLDDGQAVGVCTAAMSQAQCASLLQYPSASVQLELRNLVLQNAAPKLILWYSYSEASQGNRWADLTSVVRAQYPVSATTARAKHAHKASRKHSRKHGARRRSVGHTLAA
jgi:hypothetical protein